MARVFISYRQLDDAQRHQVRTFADKMRASGIEVVLDQFLLDETPAGPAEGWPKWSGDQAIHAERVIIIGTEAWFRCFDGAAPPGSGLGAACEAGHLRQRIYDQGGKNEDIRVVLLNEQDKAHVSYELKRYHRFHGERDFHAIIQWLGGIPAAPADAKARAPSFSTPNNLPRLQSFFGREKEIAVIREALDPGSRAWGILIHGPGGMGKTSLAVRVASDCPPGQFQRIIFISVKDRELEDDGERRLTGFILPGLLEMLNELARELDQPEILKAPEDQRIKLILGALRSERVLLILDNLEALAKNDRDQLFTFVKRLPQGCKAILTSRRPLGSSADTVVLDKLDQAAALAVLADLAQRQPLLARTTEAERMALCVQTGAQPLLLRWVAGQLGRGSCRTIANALQFLKSCPPDNDPLEFIFGDLAQEFTPQEIQVLAALAFVTQPVKLAHVAQLAGLAAEPVETALRILANRSFVFPDQEETFFALVPMVGDFVRRAWPEVVSRTGQGIVESAFALIGENGGEHYDQFPILEAAWPILSAAFPLFLSGPNDRLQTVCEATQAFLNFSGRWDERAALCQEAEKRAVAAGDFLNAGWRVYNNAWIHWRRGQAEEVLACATRMAAHWKKTEVGPREQSFVIRMRGHGCRLAHDYPAALRAYRECLDLRLGMQAESKDVAIVLNSLGEVEHLLGDLAAAKKDFHEALRMARLLGYTHGIVTYTGNLAALELDAGDVQAAVTLAREAVSLSEKLGRQELIALNSHRLARALVAADKNAEARPHAQRAVSIYSHLGVPTDLTAARATLAACEVQQDDRAQA